MTDEIKKSSAEWSKEMGLELGRDILDPDGWDRSNFDQSWAELITKDEFRRRYTISTVRISSMARVMQ